MKQFILTLIFIGVLNGYANISPTDYLNRNVLMEQGFEEQNKDEILFVFLNFTKRENALPEVQLKKIKRAKGKLKKDFSSKIASRKSNFLLCSFLDKNGNTIRQTQIENPLFENYEYVNEDDQFERILLEKEKTTLCIRTQDTENIVTLKVELIGQSEGLQPLASISLRK